ncbi:hypothetical protein AB0C90_34150 [Streptomyces sp. NPDC048550]|uniref:hypothetical protein n=1 Tax=Streptomyces sp. NPDC048550 TaxID=3155739 RepID=UPI0034270B02
MGSVTVPVDARTPPVAGHRKPRGHPGLGRQGGQGRGGEARRRAAAGETPYYVTTTYLNTGGATDAGSFNFKLLLHGADQQRAYFFAPSWGAKFEPCQEASDADLRLETRKAVTTCEIYLVPENVKPEFVGFQGDHNTTPSNETGTGPEVIWKVG